MKRIIFLSFILMFNQNIFAKSCNEEQTSVDKKSEECKSATKEQVKVCKKELKAEKKKLKECKKQEKVIAEFLEVLCPANKAEFEKELAKDGYSKSLKKKYAKLMKADKKDRKFWGGKCGDYKPVEPQDDTDLKLTKFDCKIGEEKHFRNFDKTHISTKSCTNPDEKNKNECRRADTKACVELKNLMVKANELNPKMGYPKDSPAYKASGCQFDTFFYSPESLKKYDELVEKYCK